MEKKIFAHRGNGGAAHENTLKAFEDAIILGVDGIELDVRQTKDGVLVIFHDAEIGDKKINKLSFAELNQAASAENFLVPTLEEVLKLLAGKLLVQVEIKEFGYEQAVVETALRLLPLDKFFITSFNYKAVKIIRTKFPQVQCGLLVGMGDFSIAHLVWMLKSLFLLPLETRNVNLFLPHFLLWKFGVKYFISKKHQVIVWTVDRREHLIKLLADNRVSGIITNRPALALKLKAQL